MSHKLGARNHVDGAPSLAPDVARPEAAPTETPGLIAIAPPVTAPPVGPTVVGQTGQPRTDVTAAALSEIAQDIEIEWFV